jgi:murein hydrolase activator
MGGGGRVVTMPALRLVSVVLFFISSAEGSEKTTTALEDWQNTKKEYLKTENDERQILANLYSITQRMKNMSKRRDRLTDWALSAEADVRALARDIARLQSRLRVERAGLSRRLRALYELQGESAFRSIFSSQNSLELDRNLRFLKKVAQRDYGVIRNYQLSLRTHTKKRLEIQRQIRHLVRLQNQLKNQEVELAHEQENKGGLLGQLQESRAKHLSQLKEIRESSGPANSKQVLASAFFENRGQLPSPVQGVLKKSYGYIQDDTYLYRLAHKGLFFQTAHDAEVRSVFGGQIAYAERIPGYGLSLVVDHGDHYYTVYSHMVALKAKVGESVQAGTALGVAGGASPWFGNGLYFEIRHFSDAIDPATWLNKSQLERGTL